MKMDRMEKSVKLLLKAKDDKKPFILAVGCLLSFGVAVGAIAIYEHTSKELTDSDVEKP